MDKLKYVVGELSEGKPAYMRFYGAVNENNTNSFNNEFIYIRDYIKPSKIVIQINSQGGSVLHGMGTYSLIQSSDIETETIIDGIAASMGSVIWAAGTRSYMRDYSILMIHNPFCSKGDVSEEDKKSNEQMIKAFQSQIETIYTKRFGLSRDVVRAIMDGEEGCDGTFFDARGAVKAGIIQSENIIKTKKQVRDKVKNQIDGIKDAAELQEIMSSINAELEDFKPLVQEAPIPKQNQDKNYLQKTMDEKVQEFALSSVVSQLGLGEKAGMADVVNSINSLMAAKVQLSELQNSYDELKIQKEGIDAQLKNVKDELTNVKAKLGEYVKAEQEKHEAAIVALVESAITDGKIKQESKSMWVEMAKNNFEMVQSTLESIEKPVQMSKEIANDPANISDAKDGLSEAERMMKAKMEEMYGSFTFNTLND